MDDHKGSILWGRKGPGVIEFRFELDQVGGEILGIAGVVSRSWVRSARERTLRIQNLTRAMGIRSPKSVESAELVTNDHTDQDRATLDTRVM